MAFDPMSGNPFVTVTQTPTGTSYAATQAASAQDVISFINSENRAAKAAGFETPISGGTPAGTPTGVSVSKSTDPKTGVTTEVIQVSDGWGGTTNKTITYVGTPDTPTTGNVSFDIVSSIFKTYGIDGIASQMTKIRSLYPEISSTDLVTMLKYDSRFNQPYLTRFAGNATRIQNGMTPLDEATYLNQEAGYKKIFDAYGLNTYSNQATYAKLIAGDISIDEANTRVTAAYGKVLGNANTLAAFKQFYPEISTADLAAYVLDPKIATQAIQSKTTTAEAGGQALAQGLQTAVSATTFDQGTVGYENVTRGTLGAGAAAGLTPAGMAQAYGNVAEVLPTAEKLSSIYAGQLGQYGQLQAEQEQIQGLASAKRARQALTAAEQATFSGQSGTSKGSFSTSYLSRQSSAGAF